MLSVKLKNLPDNAHLLTEFNKAGNTKVLDKLPHPTSAYKTPTS